MEPSKEFFKDNQITKSLLIQAFTILVMIASIASFFLPVRF